MHPAILAAFFATSGTAVAMCSAGIAVFLIGSWAAKNEIVQARGLDKIVALSNLCFAVPLAVFGALHLFGPEFVKDLVPKYMPGRILDYSRVARDGGFCRAGVRKRESAERPVQFGSRVRIRSTRRGRKRQAPPETDGDRVRFEAAWAIT